MVCVVAAQAVGVTELTRTSPEVADAVVANWIRLGQELNWGWSAATVPSPAALHEISYGGELLGYLAPFDDGFIVVPAYRELPPITAYSTTSTLHLSDDGGLMLMLREALASKVEAARAALAQPSPSAELQPILRQMEHDRDLWASYSSRFDQFKVALRSGNAVFAPQHMDRTPGRNLDAATSCPALLTTAWNQGSPYNSFCPMGDGGRCAVGCVATASAQILAYWRYPTNGTGSHSYVWSGDNSCGGSTSGQTLSATYSDEYDWGNIRNSYSGSETQAQKDAVAELCYEVGVAFNMDYGRCGSGASTSYAATIFPLYFGMATDIDVEYRNAYSTADAWFAILQADLNNGWPMQYRINTHSIVCDGWQVAGSNQIHLNYGWGGSSTAWYTVDNLYCPWSGCSPSVEYVVRRIHPATGTPPNPSVTLVSPNGGETATVGGATTIVWTSSSFSDNVRIQLNRNYPGGTWETIVSSTTNGGSYPWSVSGTVSTAARIRLTGATATTIGDTSDANFQIVAPPPASLVVVSPNGGESFANNERTVIRWAASNLTGKVHIELNRNYPSGAWERLTNSNGTVVTGTFSWRVGGTATSTARVRVVSISSPAVGDVSDTDFTIRGRGEGNAGLALPASTSLAAAYPNPFNPVTTIHYELADVGHVTLDVFDLTGRHVAQLVDQDQPAGKYQVTFDGARVSTGTYFLRMQAGQYHSVQKLLLLK
jgi:hypothetical protein